ncbi:tRNA-dihydrouridine synthase [Haloarcula salinisoli]|uniref:tRNA-dihydrouridine synthase n=1 Tax=Haloarcula salinisoli TaxID=2487746 RepID=A0A8J7YCQ7_9EURY|nr:tRNA-dihydrouridine synthase [Halomicroarcula salinisoli]MBX0285007.1 tRNA-dihydrouridine synthase [Halomicroarcula salinisoli]MBX0303515.1 tRNA-dihydrouridine synthase [Halomicroarcula salinisoli]
MFRPRVALASLSGEADADWARAATDHVGCAFLGGIALDEASREAAQALTDRDRSEFLPADPIAFVDTQLGALDKSPLRGAFNVRSTTLAPLERAAGVCRDHDAILELNAHCRQDEMCAVGGGESLLRDADRLAEQVRTAADTGAAVSVKVRAEVPGVDLPRLARCIDEAGADAIHVDAMDSESVVDDIATATDLFVVANNGVRGPDTAREYLEYGADAVSVGRASDDPAVLAAVREATDDWFTQEVTR